jgi:hypothetical protein
VLLPSAWRLRPHPRHPLAPLARASPVGLHAPVHDLLP